MKINLKSKNEIVYDNAVKFSNWHLKFAFLPKVIVDYQDKKCLIWLRPYFKKWDISIVRHENHQYNYVFGKVYYMVPPCYFRAKAELLKVRMKDDVGSGISDFNHRNRDDNFKSLKSLLGIKS